MIKFKKDIEKRHMELLNMFRNTLTRISRLKQSNMQTNVTAKFSADGFSFTIVVFKPCVENTFLTIYDFWDVESSAKLVDAFIMAIKSGDFNAVMAASKGY